MIKNKADFGFIYPHVAKLDIAADSDSGGRGFESLRAGQKTSFFGTRFFYPLRKQWYIITL